MLTLSLSRYRYYILWDDLLVFLVAEAEAAARRV
jgi:hypothetical protein